MCMNIIAVQCLSTLIAYCSIPFLFFLFFLSFTFLPSSLSSLFLPLLPFLSLLPFSPPPLLVRFPSVPFYPSFFSYPSIPSYRSISSYLLFPNSSPSFLSISPFLARFLPVQPIIYFLLLH